MKRLISFLLVAIVILLGTKISGLSSSLSQAGNEEATLNHSLTPEEERVIVRKGTEKPFTGKYLDNKEKGIYTCKRCGTPLYRSENKFESDCGWPGFDDEIPGAVTRIPDPDGLRTEIECAACGGHLGHVFAGEGFTPKNTRHCVNSISLNFIKDGTPQVEKAIFAGGCFWGVEYYLRKAKGVILTRVGYTGGRMENPTYKDVCGHTTGHAEAVEVAFDPSVISFEDLARLFFEIHDPTQVDGQGPDIGDQYRSEIFYLNDSQKGVAERLIGKLKKNGYKVGTRLSKVTTFWKAEEYHQDYYTKSGKQPYCHFPTKRF